MKPSTYSNTNAYFTMFNIASAQLPQIDEMISHGKGKLLRRLNVVNGNMDSILPFMDSVMEIDIFRNELLQAE